MTSGASLNIDISNICGLKCRYCRADAGTINMSLSKFEGIIRSHPEIQYVRIGGGDPLPHPQFSEMINTLLDNEKIVTVSTNLLTGTDKLAQFYNKPQISNSKQISNPKLTLQVSIPSSDRRIYHKVTSYDVLGDVIKNLTEIKENIPTVINCVVYKTNLNSVPELIDYAIDELKVPIRINLAYPVGRAVGLDILNQKELADLTQAVSIKRIEKNANRDWVISGLRFTDSSCSNIIVPCSANAYYFGQKKEECSCPERVYYDVFGNKGICEFLWGVNKDGFFKR
jgi:MoaA/NifB/PqqE/SkfB family radical SAM enzyme